MYDLSDCTDFTVAPESVALRLGGQACLECDYPGLESEEWTRGGSPFLCSSSCFINRTENGTVLCFTAFAMSDVGLYSCVALPGGPDGDDVCEQMAFVVEESKLIEVQN